MNVRRKWEREHTGHYIYVWGFDMNEDKRAEQIERTMSAYEHGVPINR